MSAGAYRFAGVILFLALLHSAWAQAAPGGNKSAAGPPAQNGYVGNQVCAGCHGAIAESYARTPMAHASGPAGQNPMAADFVHAKSGVHYRVYSRDNAVWLSFERTGDAALQGTRQLLYSIGSGKRGKTYLFSVDGFVFESPVNWYADRHRWDMAPAYGNVREIPLNLPAYPDCLRCHTSGASQPLDGTENRYPAPLFTQDGVGCERCHGPGAAHAKGGAIVNPAKLTPERRDSICMQCHLEANVAVERAGRQVRDFRPGEILDDYLRHYVVQRPGTALGANGQFEALAQSACKRKSGDKMSCMSCHDPHSRPAEEQRVSYYREKCLACHGVDFGRKHHVDKPDCTACHMPSSLSADIAHTEVTDHRIPRLPQASPQLLQDSEGSKLAPKLIPFPYSEEVANDLREQALAWQSLAEGGMKEAAPEAERMLPLAAKQSPDDAAVLAGLAYVELKNGAVDRAGDLYRRALELDRSMIDAAANLGVIEARTGHTGEAVRLWESAWERAPGKSGIGMNLARVYCQAGKLEQARSTLERVLRFNPDLGAARMLMHGLSQSPADCGP